MFVYRPVGRAVECSSVEREISGFNLGSVKLVTELPTAPHRCNISSKKALYTGHNNTEIGSANSLHALRCTVSIMKNLI